MMEERWLQTARRREVVVRALKVALVVGTILMAINHGDVILTGNVTPGAIAKIALTFLVPYSVSTFSAVQTIRRG